MNELVRTSDDARTPVAEFYRPSAALDPNRFDYLMRLAEQMARCGVVPESLCKTGPKNNKKDLEFEQIVANCFLVAEVADRWQISPFALLQGTSIVHGKLCFEGKIIAGVLEGLYGIHLTFEWNGESGEKLGCRMRGVIDGQEYVWPPKDSGKQWCTVAEWKTTGEGSPWSRPSDFPRQMTYRGSREWVRIYKPVLLLGIYGDDEIEMEVRAQNARPIASAADRIASTTAADTEAGFNSGNVARALADQRGLPMDTIKNKEKEKVPAKAEENSAGGAGAKTDRSGPDENGGARPAGVSGSKGPGTATAGAAGANETAGGNAPAAGGSSYDFKAYSTQLSRASQESSLKKFDQDFRNKNAWTTEEAALVALRKIYGAHLRKVKGELDHSMLHAELSELGAI